MSERLVVLVEFEVAPDRLADFRRLVAENASASLRHETGCHRFDILHPEPAEPRVVLYEIYRDAAAFDAHLRAPHFAAFDEATRAMVRNRRIRRFMLDEGAAA